MLAPGGEREESGAFTLRPGHSTPGVPRPDREDCLQPLFHGALKSGQDSTEKLDGWWKPVWCQRLGQANDEVRPWGQSGLRQGWVRNSS